MLWLILRGLGYPGGTEEYFWAAEKPREVQPLDPIEVAGNLHARRVVALVSTWSSAVRLLRILYDRTSIPSLLCAKAEVNEEGNRRVEYTCRRYVEHLGQLERAAVVKACRREEVKAFGSYFSVPKTLTTDRAIFNGSRLKTLFLPPPATGLADVVTICKRFADFVGEHKAFYGFILDIRHCFHQMGISEELSAYFGLACGEACFRFVVLPMGWTYSPVIAQACGWSLLAGRESSQEQLFEEAFMQDDRLPSFLVPRHVDGFAVLYYDNYFVITTEAQATEKIRVRLCSNITKCGSLPLGKAIKEVTSFSHKTLRKSPLGLLGCEFAVTQKRARDSDSWILQWRVRPDKIPRELTWGGPGTLRSAVQKLGKILHSLVLSLKPLGATELGQGVLGLLSQIGRMAAKNGWDAPWTPAEEHMRILEESLAQLKDNEWIQRSSTVAPNIVVVSDASGIGYGWFVAQISPPMLLATRSKVWKASMEGQHIFRKEGFAALSALMFARRLTGQNSMTIVVDNTAVAGVLRRVYSFCETVAKWLSSSKAAEMELEVLTVVSADNIADPLSRNMETVANLPAFLKLVMEGRIGRRSGTPAPVTDDADGLWHGEDIGDSHIEDELEPSE
jgi:hypothetical protein